MVFGHQPMLCSRLLSMGREQKKSKITNNDFQSKTLLRKKKSKTNKFVIFYYKQLNSQR